LTPYTRYSVSCSAICALILGVGKRRLDQPSWERLRLTAGGWWLGWTSASIARAGFPPPRPLGPRGQKRLAYVSLALVALGMIDVIRFLATGGRAAER